MLIMRAQKFYILSWGAMLLLFIVLLNTLVKLYWEKEAVLAESLTNKLENTVELYNRMRIDTNNFRGNILSLMY